MLVEIIEDLKRYTEEHLPDVFPIIISQELLQVWVVLRIVLPGLRDDVPELFPGLLLDERGKFLETGPISLLELVQVVGH